ncbi:MAG: glutamate--cysteine ligase [Pseudomonadota bacterium]
MGQEILQSRFSDRDFDEFRQRLDRETEILGQWMKEGVFAAEGGVGGLELEAWLVDQKARPAPLNEAFLARLDSPLVVPELATFNVEVNAQPRVLRGNALSRMHEELRDTWSGCNATASGLNARLAMIGVLPTLRETDLTLANMSPLRRYRALNEQVFRMRGGRPIKLRIDGQDKLDLVHRDVMLEAAATSFQLHLKAGMGEVARLYNASKVLAAPMVAVSANAPYLFGHDLWNETRIPLFEQAVSVGGTKHTTRVTYGVRYVKESIFECYEANRDRYPILLPWVMDEDENTLPHLRLHNGTIWRWNRPLIGFDADNRPHFRIEHRVMPAGPTLVDMIANAAFYFGAVRFLASQAEVPEEHIPFSVSRANFYQAAKEGLDAEVTWLDGQRGRLADLCLDFLLPQAEEGLSNFGIESAEAARWLGIIRDRIRMRRTGADWQRLWVQRHGADLQAMTLQYLENQATDDPVHSWPL